MVSELGPCFDANPASVFSGWFVSELLDFGVNLGSGISAEDSNFSVDVRSGFGAGPVTVI